MISNVRKNKTRLAIVHGIVTYYIKSSFYKYIQKNKKGMLSRYLERTFIVINIHFDKRINYDIHPYKVYIIDGPRLFLYYIKMLVQGDIIISPGYGSIVEPFLAILIGKLRNAIVLIKDTHWYWKSSGLSRYFWYIYVKLLKLSDGILVPGRASFSFWKKYGFENVFIVHYYWLESEMEKCDNDITISKILKKKNIENYGLKVMYLGRIIKKRGIDTLIKAFARFVKTYRKDSLLIMAGSGDYVDHAMKLVKKYDIEDHVIFTGPVSEKIKGCLYDVIDIFVYVPIMTDIPEEWSVPPFEAMSKGKPVIVSNIVGALPDIYGGVVVVKWGSVDDLYNALVKLSDERARIEISRKGQEIFRSITPLGVYKELLLAIKSIIRQKTRRE